MYITAQLYHITKKCSPCLTCVSKMYLSVNCISLFKMCLQDSYFSSLFKLCHSSQNLSLSLKNVFVSSKYIPTPQNISMVKKLSFCSIFKFVSMAKTQYSSFMQLSIRIFVKISCENLCIYGKNSVFLRLCKTLYINLCK